MERSKARFRGCDVVNKLGRCQHAYLTLLAQVLLHFRNVRIVNVLMVQVFDHLGYATKSHKEEIKPTDEITLFWGALVYRHHSW